MSTSAAIGSRVKAYREGRRAGVRRKLTQEHLADQIGMSARWVRMLEQGQVDPKLSELRKLAAALQVSERDLIDGGLSRRGGSSLMRRDWSKGLLCRRLTQ